MHAWKVPKYCAVGAPRVARRPLPFQPAAELLAAPRCPSALPVPVALPIAILCLLCYEEPLAMAPWHRGLLQRLKEQFSVSPL